MPPVDWSSLATRRRVRNSAGGRRAVGPFRASGNLSVEIPSGGVAEVDAPYAEGRDVSALIDQVLTGRPEITVDTGGRGGQPAFINDHPRYNTVGQPVVGMTGGSYGGGIQFAAAAFDKRIKAIVPVITWN